MTDAEFKIHEEYSTAYDAYHEAQEAYAVARLSDDADVRAWASCTLIEASRAMHKADRVFAALNPADEDHDEILGSSCPSTAVR